MVDLQRCSIQVLVRTDLDQYLRCCDLHLPKVNDVLLLGSGVDLHNTDGRTDTQRSIENIHTQDYGVSFAECSDGLQTTGPDCLWRSISALGLHYLVVVCDECVKQVVDDISCTGISKSMSNSV